jgi:hypothetical protein
MHRGARRAFIPVVTAVCVCLALVGCKEDANATDANSATGSPGAGATGDPSNASATDQLINSCVQLVQFKASIGDPFWQSAWDGSWQDEQRVRQECTTLGATDRAALERLSVEWAATEDQIRAVEQQKQLAATSPAQLATAAAAPVPAPQQISNGCDPNYGGCVPIDSDVDCAGGSGNGPSYISGPVRVIGNDIYGLDRDGNGVGCD